MVPETKLCNKTKD